MKLEFLLQTKTVKCPRYNFKNTRVNISHGTQHSKPCNEYFMYFSFKLISDDL